MDKTDTKDTTNQQPDDPTSDNKIGSPIPIISQQNIAPGAIKQRHLVPSPTQKGDMYYGQNGGFANLPIGMANQVLKVIGGVPVWGSGNPSGSILIYGGATAPAGYLLCDGTAVSRTTYAALFAIISTTYGTGDGSTTFNVPNLKGNVPVGYDASQTEFNALGKTGGEKTHTLIIAEMPRHQHGMSPLGQPLTYIGTGGSLTTPAGGTTVAGANIDNQGFDGAHQNLQPYLTLNFIIKT